GFGVEGGDGFDQARDGEGVADAAGSANQAQDAAVARELNGNTHEGREAGAVNLRRAIQRYDDFARALLHDRLQRAVELFAGFANGEASMHFENGDLAGFANLNLHGQAFNHERGDRKSTRLNSSHSQISYAVFCLKKKK